LKYTKQTIHIMKNTTMRSFAITVSAIALSAGFACAASVNLVDTTYSTNTTLNGDEYFATSTTATWTINSGVVLTLGDTANGSIFVDGHEFNLDGGGTLLGTVSDSRGIRFSNGDNQNGVLNIMGGTTLKFTDVNTRVYAKTNGTNVSGTINIEQGSTFIAAGTYDSGTGKFTSTNTSEVVPVDIAVYGTGQIQSSYDGTYTTLTVVPEPSSAALLGLGGLALIFRRRK
jgi:Ni,Fe-hydrogenase III small subunit